MVLHKKYGKNQTIFCRNYNRCRLCGESCAFLFFDMLLVCWFMKETCLSSIMALQRIPRKLTRMNTIQSVQVNTVYVWTFHQVSSISSLILSSMKMHAFSFVSIFLLESTQSDIIDFTDLFFFLSIWVGSGSEVWRGFTGLPVVYNANCT